jgi:hypothetical protein
VPQGCFRRIADELEVVHTFSQGTKMHSAALETAALATLDVVLLEAVETGGNRT